MVYLQRAAVVLIALFLAAEWIWFRKVTAPGPRFQDEKWWHPENREGRQDNLFTGVNSDTEDGHPRG